MQTGEKIPNLTLYNTDKMPVALQEQKGISVLLFFPLAFTSVCTAELCGVRDDIEKYNSLKAKVYGISVDSVFTLARFKDDQQLNFELLSDFNKEASTAFGVLIENFAYEMKGVSKRAVFVIDEAGIIRYKEICPSPGDMPDFKQLNSALEQLNK